MFKRSKISTGVLLAFGGIAALPQAMAQDAPQRVEVTGSNIKRTDSETASPVTVITRKEIESSGKQTISDVIRSLPIDNNGSVPTAFSNGFAHGGSGVSLRGLTVNSTLVLLNGRRLAPYGLADDGQRTFVDLSSIPLEAVERVEIVKDGASAIYGSDAIAGVVNIILRNQYKGLVVNGSVGQSRYGDGTTTRASVAGGFGSLEDQKFNAMFVLEAAKINGIDAPDRAGRGGLGAPDLSPYGYAWNVGSIRGTRITNSTSTATFPSGNGAGWVAPVSGLGAQDAVAVKDYVALPSYPAACNSSLPVPSNRDGCAWDILKYQQYQTPEEKLNLFVRGSMDFGNNVLGYAEVGYLNSKVKTKTTPTPLNGSWFDFSTGSTITNQYNTLGPTHPDNPYPGQYARLIYTPIDLGPRTTDTDNSVVRALVGVKGVFVGWDYDMGALWTKSKVDVTQNGYVRNSVFQQYLLDGTYRIGANAYLNSPAVYAALSPTLSSTATNSVTSFDVKVSRELMALPGGAMGVAAGVEYRKEKTDSPPTPYTYNGDIIGLGYSGFSSSRNVTAVYAELNAPVLKTLELSAAVRNDRYSDFGNSTTPKVGAKWTPVPQLAIRGTYAEGFRAPGPAESGQSVGGSAGYTVVTDPVRCPNGVPLPGLQLSDCKPQVLAVSTANPLVKPETAKSYSLGFILEPTKALSASVDFWRIERKDEILGADPQTVINNPSGFPVNAISRDASSAVAGFPGSGTILGVNAGYTNGPSTTVSGVDVDLRYRLALGSAGRLTTNLTWTHMTNFRRTQPDGSVAWYAGTQGPTGLSSASGTPADRGVLTFDWERGPIGFTTRINYVGAMKNVESKNDYDINGCLTVFADGSDAPAGCRIPSFTWVDVSGRWQPMKGLTVYGSIQNLFDRVAPLNRTAYYGSTRYNATYNQTGAIGRFFTLGAKYEFF